MTSFLRLTGVHRVVYVPATTVSKERDKDEYSVLGQFSVGRMITWDSNFGHQISPMWLEMMGEYLSISLQGPQAGRWCPQGCWKLLHLIKLAHHLTCTWPTPGEGKQLAAPRCMYLVRKVAPANEHQHCSD